MDRPFEELANLDRLIHEPARLAIMTALASCQRADFLFLQRLIGLSKGNLSSHLSKLEEASLVEIEKKFVGKIPSTQVALTAKGRETIERHWQQLENLRQDINKWKPSAE